MSAVEENFDRDRSKCADIACILFGGPAIQLNWTRSFASPDCSGFAFSEFLLARLLSVAFGSFAFGKLLREQFTAWRYTTMTINNSNRRTKKGDAKPKQDRNGLQINRFTSIISATWTITRKDIKSL